jgi:hypothetical protein
MVGSRFERALPEHLLTCPGALDSLDAGRGNGSFHHLVRGSEREIDETPSALRERLPSYVFAQTRLGHSCSIALEYGAFVEPRGRNGWQVHGDENDSNRPVGNR